MSAQTNCRVCRVTSRSRFARRRPRRRRRRRRCRQPRRLRRRRWGAARRPRSTRGTRRTARTSSPSEWLAGCTSSPTGRRIAVPRICCYRSRSQERPSRRSGNRLVGLLLLILLRQAVHQLCHLASFGGRARGGHVLAATAPTETDRTPGGRWESSPRRGFEIGCAFHLALSTFPFSRLDHFLASCKYSH